MKKTLIALAAVAATSAAMAQVTLSGTYGFGFVSDNVSDISTTGMQTTDGNFTLSASEDLGGGLKVMASMAVDTKGRDSTATGRDASVTLMGGFGTLTMGTVEAGNPVNAYFGSDGRGLDGSTKVTTGASNRDLLSYTLPTMVEGLKVSLSKTDNTGAGAIGISNSVAAAVGTTGLSVGYGAGPVAVGVALTTYDGHTTDTRTTFGGSYDAGVAKLSVGYQTYKYVAVGTQKLKETVVGVSAPVASNISLGLTYAKAKQGTTVNKKGYDLGATYSLSKRTSVNVSYASVTPSVGANKDKYSRVKLTHKF